MMVWKFLNLHKTMKLNKIHYNLKRLYEGKSDVDDTMAAYFSCTNEVKRFIKIFKAGYWSVMPFAFGTYDNFALKLNPNNIWPILAQFHPT